MTQTNAALASDGMPHCFFNHGLIAFFFLSTVRTVSWESEFGVVWFHRSIGQQPQRPDGVPLEGGAAEQHGQGLHRRVACRRVGARWMVAWSPSWQRGDEFSEIQLRCSRRRTSSQSPWRFVSDGTPPVFASPASKRNRVRLSTTTGRKRPAAAWTAHRTIVPLVERNRFGRAPRWDCRDDYERSCGQPMNRGVRFICYSLCCYPLPCNIIGASWWPLSRLACHNAALQVWSWHWIPHPLWRGWRDQLPALHRAEAPRGRAPCPVRSTSMVVVSCRHKRPAAAATVAAVPPAGLREIPWTKRSHEDSGMA